MCNDDCRIEHEMNLLQKNNADDKDDNNKTYASLDETIETSTITTYLMLHSSPSQKENTITKDEDHNNKKKSKDNERTMNKIKSSLP